ncbi:hypothetical protein [Komagataeibacter nataicola]|uniref:hypothetical protein n=1 Tax=Komagataeibacter nataicola TaxID=265960 RepID=UPI0028A90344|nr:hypothetical protein [Komagataeibacter nataicola]
MGKHGRSSLRRMSSSVWGSTLRRRACHQCMPPSSARVSRPGREAAVESGMERLSGSKTD